MKTLAWIVFVGSLLGLAAMGWNEINNRQQQPVPPDDAPVEVQPLHPFAAEVIRALMDDRMGWQVRAGGMGVYCWQSSTVIEYKYIVDRWHPDGKLEVRINAVDVTGKLSPADLQAIDVALRLRLDKIAERK